VFGNLGLSEILIIAAIALVIMGPEKFPEFMKIALRAYRDFRGYIDDIKHEMAEELHPVKRELQQLARYNPEEYVESLAKAVSSAVEDEVKGVKDTVEGEAKEIKDAVQGETKDNKDAFGGEAGAVTSEQKPATEFEVIKTAAESADSLSAPSAPEPDSAAKPADAHAPENLHD
jgi:sec-independent protein translocase protein TatB